ncbi:MAG: ParB/RepB/Spo0J family partition protein [Phycisphaeraceae bacterium]
MDLIEIPLEQLRPHPHNSNVMPERLLARLTAHIERTDRYPPLIVRPLGDGTYQILDGHHRAEALRRLGRAAARCVAWEVDDDEALLLMATLNRLEGDDDASKRAALLARLSERHDLKTLAAQLPERSEQLKKLLALNDPAPPPRPPQPIDQMPQAVHFFLLPEQRRRLDQRLKAIGGSREAALMTLVDRRS